jgi:predicted permease
MHTWGTPVAPVATQTAFYQSVEERLRAFGPAGLINHLPLAGDVWTLSMRVDGRPEPPPEEGLSAVYRVATPGYFEAMGIKAVRGRVLTGSDGPGAPLVVVVNETLARQIWPDEDPVGKRLAVADGGFMTVCGVVRDVVQSDWIGRRAPEVYLPLYQHPRTIGRPHTSSMTAVAGSGADIARLVADVNNSVPVSDVQTMEDVVATATRASRVYAALLGVFAGSALLLALIGLYGLVSSDVTRRTKEIGIRTAIGAKPSEIGAMIVRDAMTLAAIGAGIGIISSLAFTRALESMLYGVKPADALTLFSVVLLFGGVSALAAALPALRAARLDPVRALRGE